MASPARACVLSALLLLVACGKQEAQRNPGGGTVNERPAASETPQLPQKPAADKAAKIKTLNEDGTETNEQSAADSGTHHSLLTAVASTVTAANAAVPMMSSTWQEGVNYSRLVPAQPTDAPAGQVEVLEFFWYGCPHCYALDPAVEAWVKQKPSYVTFTRVPVLWNEGDRSLGRLYYTVQGLGKIDAMHSAIFKEIHVNNDPLIGRNPDDTAEAERVQVVFAKRFGISEQDFRGKFEHDMGVNTALQHADQLIERYRVTSVPNFVVNGKFIADVASAGSPEKLFSMLNDLVAAEHKRQP